MSIERNDIDKNEKGVSIEECIKKADKFISKNGLCLFLFDVKDSKKHHDRQALQEQLIDLTKSINSEFKKYLPKNNLMVSTRIEEGFSHVFGDGSWSAINNSQAIEKIIDHIHQKMPSIQFYFDVARDGSDTPNINILK